MTTNDTHDPSLKSWVESANDPASEFPIQNLPLCAFVATHDTPQGPHSHVHLGCVIGDQILDISGLNEAGFFGSESDEGAAQMSRLLQFPFWDGVASQPGAIAWLRRRLQAFLSADAPVGQQARRLRTKVMRPLKGTPLTTPMRVFNYTDFYASIDHATTVGSMFRPDAPLLPNYKHLPIGYHGRASSVVASGAEIVRPSGQLPPESEGGTPTFGPTKQLDFELEVGVFVGRGNALGQPVAIDQAEGHLFGVCLVNDWSARDMQRWEYQPLGPFLAKNFATQVSPLIVTMEALEPFRCAARARGTGDPAPLPYLSSAANAERGGIDITLEVQLRTQKMWEAGTAPVTICTGRTFKDMYWTFAQMLTHHTSNGCNMLPGDLIASGTVSGPGAGERGCLLEATWAGRGGDGKPLPRKPIALPSGETRLFLEDGDEVILRGWCERDGFRKVGLGECRGRVVASK